MFIDSCCHGRRNDWPVFANQLAFPPEAKENSCDGCGRPGPSLCRMQSLATVSENSARCARAFPRMPKSWQNIPPPIWRDRRNNPRVIDAAGESGEARSLILPKLRRELALAYVIRLFLYAPRTKIWKKKHIWRSIAPCLSNPTYLVAYLARGRLKWTPFNHFPTKMQLTI